MNAIDLLRDPFVVSSEETTLIRRISDVVRSGRGPDFVAEKGRGRGDSYTV